MIKTLYTCDICMNQEVFDSQTSPDWYRFQKKNPETGEIETQDVCPDCTTKAVKSHFERKEGHE